MKVLSNSSLRCAGWRLPSASVKHQRSVHPVVRLLSQAALPLRFTTAATLKLLHFLPARKTLLISKYYPKSFEAIQTADSLPQKP